MISLIIGGARSGKSELAERRAASADGPVTYFATGSADGDADFADRIKRHRDRRSPSWETVEIPRGGDLAAELSACRGVALVDSLGTWVAGFADFAPEPAPLLSSLVARRSRGNLTVLVSEEVGLGVHPATEAGRRFRDCLGELNGTVAEVADEVILAVAGRALRLPPEPW